MIESSRREGGFGVSGHAQYAPPGQDLVCAGVSTLVQAFTAAVEKLTTGKLNTEIATGNAIVSCGNLTEAGGLLLDFFVGVNMIADEYPDYVRVENSLPQLNMAPDRACVGGTGGTTSIHTTTQAHAHGQMQQSKILTRQKYVQWA